MFVSASWRRLALAAIVLVFSVAAFGQSIDLQLYTISDNPADITLGQGTVTYTVTVYNASGSTATNVILTNTLPTSSTYSSSTASGTGSCSNGGTEVTCTWPSIGASTLVTATITVTPGVGGANTLTASVTGDQADPTPANNSKSETTTVNATINLSVYSMSGNPAAITLGQGNVTYTIYTYNFSSSKATNPVLTINLPASSTYVSHTVADGGSCTPSGGVVTCNWPVQNSGGYFGLTVTVTPGVGGTNTISASIAADQGDPTPANNTLSESTTVNATIDLSLYSISDSPTNITLGQGDVTYTIYTYNFSTSKATNPVMTATLPASSTYVSHTVADGGSCSPSGGVLTCNWPLQNSGGFFGVTVTVTPGVGGTNTISASVAADQGDPTPANNTLSEGTTVNATIDLSLYSISDNPTNITLGQGNVVYTIYTYNYSTSKATNPVMTATLPASSTYVSHTVADGGSCTPSGGVLTCNWPVQNSGGFFGVTVTVTPGVGGTNTISASVAADQGDPTPANNTLSEGTTVNATIDLSVYSTSDNPNDITLGQGNVVYTINTYNYSTSKATGVVLTTTIPASSTYVSHTVTNSGSCTPSGGVLTCNWPLQNSGTSHTVTVTVTPGVGGTNTLSASIAADQGDPTPANNTLSESTTVNATINLAIYSISDNPGDITLGQGNVVYTLSTYNYSTSKATGVVLTANLPASSTYVSHTVTNSGSCSPSGGVLTCNWTQQNSGTTHTVTVTVTPGVGGTNTISASIAGDQGDPTPANNSLSESTTVNATINLGLTISDSPDPRVLAAGNVTYTANISSATSSKATNPLLSFTLPTPGIYVSATPSTGGSCSQAAGIVTCTWVDITGFGTRSASIVITPTAAGQIVANATISADQGDPNTANNSDSETTNINPGSAPTITSYSPSSGPVSQVVGITGLNFFSSTSVKFNGVSSTFTVNNNGSITATVPAGATTGPVAITNSVGTTTGSNFTVTPAPNLSITKTASAATVPTSSPITYTLTINNVGAGPANDVTVTDTLPAGTTLTSITETGWTCTGNPAITCTLDSPPFAAAASSTITIDITAPSSGTTVTNTATVSTTTPDSNAANNTSSVSVGVVGCPGTPAITAPVTVCASSTGHTASTPVVPGGTYLWSITNGTIVGSNTGNVVNFDASTTNPITLSVDVFVTSCPTVSNSATVNVSTPTATITPSGPTTFCSGGSVTLTANAGSSWLWSTAETTQSIVVSASQAVFVTVTNAAGCSATSAGTNVVVNPAPATPTITPSGPTTFCAGGSVTLTASAASSWLWSNGATTQSIVVSSSGTFSVQATDGSGCSATSAPASVTVYAPPAAPVITTSGPTALCPSGSVTLTASAASSWLWSNGATTQSITVSIAGSYSVQAFDGNGCGATSAPVNVTTDAAPPVPAITASGPTTFCSGGNVTLTSTPATSYLWSNGATTQSIVVNTAGSYSVQVFNAGGCSSTSAPTPVTVNPPPPTPTITAGGPTTFCAGSSVPLTASSAASWLWSNGATSQGIVVTTSGTFTVTVTDGNGCSSTSAPLTVTATPLPAATITPDGPTTFCAGDDVTLTASNGSSWLWSNGAVTQSIVVNSSGTFSVQVTSGTCSATSAPVSVSVTPAPNAPITGPGPVCATTTGHTGSVPSQPGASYAWTIGGGTITGGLGTNTITFTAGSFGSVTLAVTVTAAGCSTSTTFPVPILPPPVVAITAPASALFGELVTASVPTQAGATFVWSVTNGTISTGQGTRSVKITAGSSGTSMNVSLLATSSGGCSAANSVAIALGGSDVPVCETVPPLLFAPANNANVASPVTFQWGPVTNTSAYELWINGARADTTGGTSSTQQLPAGAFTWFVVAKLNGGCNPLTSNTRSFTIQQSNECPPHDRPRLTAPAQGSTLNSPLVFSWTAVPQAIGYRVLAGVGGASPEEIGSTSGATTSLTAAVSPGAITSFVEALFSGCPATRSDAVTFNVAAPDPCANRASATPVAPANDSTVNASSVEFQWLPASRAGGYRVWVSVAGGVPAVLGETTETTLRGFVGSGNAVWWIESLYPGCASTESQRFRFTIPAQTNCGTARPEIVAPANGTIVTSSDVTFHWTAVSGAIGYEVYLSLSDGTPSLIGTTTGATSLTRAVPAGTLEWFVRVLLDRCPSRDSQTARFAFEPPAACADRQRPLLVEPLDNAHATSPLSFSWNAPAGATSYELHAARGESAPTILTSTTATQATGVTLPNGRVRWFVRAFYGQNCSPLDSAERELLIVPTPAACTPLAPPVLYTPGQISAGSPLRIQWSPVAGATSYQLQIADNAAFTGAQTINTSATQHVLNASNDGTAERELHVRVRALDARCTAPAGNVSPFGPVAVIFILPRTTTGGSTPLSDPAPVTFTFNLGPEYAGQTFTAVALEPWLSVTPSSGTVAAGGTTLTVVASTSGLPVGTSLGAIQITLSSPSAGNVRTTTSTTVTPAFSVNLVTPVSPTPKDAPPPDALIIPAVAHADGINSHFQSDVRVSNTSARLMTYQLTFTPSGESGISQGQQSTFSIDPGRTIALDDILKSWFGTGNGSTMGTLEVRPLTETATSTSSAAFNGLVNLVTFASSRTFNVTANGTFGQYIPAIPFANFIGHAAVGDVRRVLSLQQIAQSPAYRTNLGLLEASGQPASLLVRVFGQQGEYLTDFPVNLKGGQHLQLNAFLHDQGLDPLTDARVEVEVVSGGGKVTAYASVLDNATSDPLLVTPVSIADSGASKWVVPGVADLATGFANWQTDMRLFNAGTEPVEATLLFYSQNGGEPKSATITIPAGQVRQFDRALASLFNASNDGGAVHITTPNAARLIATARTYNNTATGTYGQFISAVTSAEGAGIESRPLQLLQVEESDRFRSNIGLVEMTGKPVTLELSIVPPDAKFTAVTEIPLGANEFRQLGSLLASFGLDDTHNARVTVRVIAGEGRVTAYASVIDMQTNDPTYVPAQ